MANPDEILKSTSPQIRTMIVQILEVEKDYQYIQNIDSDRALEKEISGKIKKLIERENS